MANKYTKKLNKARKAYDVAIKNASSSSYGDKIKQTAQELEKTKEFTYDAKTDPQYQAIKKQYEAAGKLAMKDTLAQSAALTGGYGNSYGQVAGQQVNNQYQKQALDTIPDLYAAAYSMHSDKQNQLKDKLSMYQSLENTEYAKNQDKIGNIYNRMQYYQGLSDQEDEMALSLLGGKSGSGSSGGSRRASKSTVEQASGNGKLGNVQISGENLSGGASGLGDTEKADKGTTSNEFGKILFEVDTKMMSQLNSFGYGPEAALNYIAQQYNNGTISTAEREDLENHVLSYCMDKNYTINMLKLAPEAMK